MQEHTIKKQNKTKQKTKTKINKHTKRHKNCLCRHKTSYINEVNGIQTIVDIYEKNAIGYHTLPSVKLNFE